MSYFKGRVQADAVPRRTPTPDAVRVAGGARSSGTASTASMGLVATRRSASRHINSRPLACTGSLHPRSAHMLNADLEGLCLVAPKAHL
ncbi:hypothetical protein EVAR_10996_1 [Eumeta japonica]|uniref:Uncharacterized protein n=1 Tax=Eumeta variegata TaxID=151549 RepID=A0A4C1YLK6_EUMVA|nr:hypothetical protein EVAR_10996_1 [Eumeta japonica]